MGKAYFRNTFLIFCFALAAGLVSRVVLRLQYMDAATGFYIQPTLWEAVLNAAVLLAATLLMLMNRLRRADHDYPIWRHSRALDIVGVLTGLAIAAYLFIDYLPRLLHPFDEPLAVRIGVIVTAVFGALSAISFILLGIRGRNASLKGYLVICPCLWQTIMVVTRFNSYATLTTIPDNLFIVLFMLFAALFLLGQARTVSGLGRQDGRNYAIPAGLCMALCGFIAVVPNYAAAVVQGGGLPAPMLSCAESVYIFLLSAYGVLFVRNIVKSIGTV